MHLSKQSLPDFTHSLQQGKILTIQLSLGHQTGQLVVSMVMWSLLSVSLAWLHYCLCSEVVRDEGDAVDCSVVREATSWALKPLLVGWHLRLCSPTRWCCWLDSMFRQGCRQGFTIGWDLRLFSAIGWSHRLAPKLGTFTGYVS